MNGIDMAEFDEIFNNWYDPLRNFIYYKTGDVQVAEDIAQDTFLKIWEKRSQIKKETVKPLLFKIAYNLFINRIQHQKVSFKFAEQSKGEKTHVPADYELEMAEFDAKLQRALASLDERNRTVFLMNRIEDFTYTQIAEQLGLSVKAVEKRMEKALSFLRLAIDKNI
jgi:RNA polymerase sigma-70 factor (ECF subfamily)